MSRSVMGWSRSVKVGGVNVRVSHVKVKMCRAKVKITHAKVKVTDTEDRPTSSAVHVAVPATEQPQGRTVGGRKSAARSSALNHDADEVALDWI